MMQLVLAVVAIALVASFARAAEPIVAEPIPATLPVRAPADKAYRPATLYWGGYRHMEQLADPNAQWDFVKEHADGLLLHGAYWMHDPKAMEVAGRLAEVLRRHDKPNMLEAGWPHFSVDDFDNMGRDYGIKHARKIADLRAAGLRVDEVMVDWHLFIFKMAAQRYPSWTSADVLAQITGDRANYPASGPAFGGYWGDYVRELNAALPEVPIGLCVSPVYLRWQGMPTYGPRVMTLDPLDDAPIRQVGEEAKRPPSPILVDGKPVRFDWDGYDVLDQMMRVGRPFNVTGFITDSPYNYTWQWANAAARDNHAAKILTYERWLHAQGLRHTFVANHTGRDFEKLAPDAWDATFKRGSLLALQRHQLSGGRADRYVMESWYDGPFAMVPETKDGSFTNLVAEAVRYLKGTGQALAVRSEPVSPGVYDVTITNEGTVACLPALRGEGDLTATHGEQDVTTDLLTADGYVPDRLLAPGGSLSIRVTARSPQGKVNVFWNPQDPSGKPRAELTFSPAGE